MNRQTETMQATETVQTELRRSMGPDVPVRPSFRLLLFVGLVTVAAHGVGIGNGFLGWDDADTVLGNLHIRALNAENLLWMFTTVYMGPYQPLSWLSLAVDYRIWGLTPVGFHLTNVVLHVMAAMLCVSVAWRLYRFSGVPVYGTRGAVALGAASAALFFAAHPLRVESVAWVTERRDVLSGALALAAVLAYLSAFSRDGSQPAVRRRSLWWAWGWFALAGLAKATVVPVPVVLLLIDWYPLRRYRSLREPAFRRCLVEKVPAFGIALALSAMAIYGQAVAGTLAPPDGFSLGRRVANALFGIGFYLSKSLVPLYLAPLYEQPERLALWHYAYIVLGGVLLVVATSVGWIWRHRVPAFWVAWLSFLVLLSPVSGLIQAGPQIAADRYTYLCLIPLAVAAGRGLLWLASLYTVRPVALLAGTATLLLVMLSFRQTLFWNNDMDLWRYAVRVQPTASLACANLAVEYYQDGNLAQAERYARMALRLRPDNAAAHNVLGNVLADQGRLEESLREYQIAMEIRPDEPTYMLNAAAILRHLDRREEAIKLLERALQIRPDYLAAVNNLALLYKQMKQYERAEQLLRRIVQLDPQNATAMYNLGNLKREQGKLTEAIGWYQMALRHDPADASAAVELARVYQQQGDWKGAIAVLRHTYLQNPTHTTLRYQLGLLLAMAPVEELREPRVAEQHGRWLVQERRDPRGFEVIAAALAVRGQFEQAVRTIEQGIAVVRRLGLQELLRAFETQRDLYREGQLPRLDEQPSPRQQ